MTFSDTLYLIQQRIFVAILAFNFHYVHRKVLNTVRYLEVKIESLQMLETVNYLFLRDAKVLYSHQTVHALYAHSVLYLRGL